MLPAFDRKHTQMPDLSPSLSTEPIITETRQQQRVRLGHAVPRFLQGVFPFMGRGFFDLGPLHDSLTYTVPSGKTAEVVYFRAGNLSDDLVYLALCVSGDPVRYFPVGPKADFHVPLSIVETHSAGSRIEVGFAAARGLSGSIVIDVGLLEEKAP